MQPLILRYHAPAEDSARGWEHESLPLGNGYMGANVFGGVQRERIQITENSLENPGHLGGLNNFAELYIRFDHDVADTYERGLRLDDAMAYCRYECRGITYTREYFTSYPDKALVVKLTASKPGGLSFEISPQIPFLKDYALKPGDGGGKSGNVSARDDTIIISGKAHYYSILFEGRLRVIAPTGAVSASKDALSVRNADEAVIIFALGTNYRLTSRVFLEDDPGRKLLPENPAGRVEKILAAAVAKGCPKLLERHLEDYRELFGRVRLEVDGSPGDGDASTDALLRAYGAGAASPYLECLYFQYGRYLLIASSRPGGLPCNLQGIWNCHDQSPWGSGYWHNINVQMNYWPAFNTNLAELFKPYVDFNAAFRPCAEALATRYIRENNPENATDAPGECGWTIGTSSYAYTISDPGIHSGPGTGGLTTKMFWDYYDFTGDTDILRDCVCPVLLSMSKFLTKTVRNYDGGYLASFSASPEQLIAGKYAKDMQYYHTVGCAFDQQMIFENGRDLLKAAAILGCADAHLETQARQLQSYNPVEVGWSGQVKEYSEENFYGEIGEYAHRHISQLVALYPGTLITRETPAWMDAAKVSLNERGDDSTGWALAHRLNAWARTGDGNRAYKLLRQLLGSRTLPNLWDTHPPFQIDGNLGGTAGVAEMLLQSHEPAIRVLPALPDAWPAGRFEGLVARGAFVISAEWSEGVARQIEVHSLKGLRCRIACDGIEAACVGDALGREVEFVNDAPGTISFDTIGGGNYVIRGMRPGESLPAPRTLDVVLPEMRLKWQGCADAVYNVYRAVDGAPVYRKIAECLAQCGFCDSGLDFSVHEIVTYKVTACRPDGSAESQGALKTMNHAKTLDLERYRLLVRQLNL